MSEKCEDRKEKEKLFKQEIILEAAEKVFSEKGYTKATISEIAKEAGFSKGALYLYFKSKDEIQVTLQLNLLKNFLESMRLIAKAEKSAEKKLKMLADSFYSIYILGSEKNKVHEFLDSTKSRVEFFDCKYLSDFAEAENEIFELVESLIIQGQKENFITNKISSKILSHILQAFFKGITIKSIIDRKELIEDNISIDDFLEKSYEVIIKSLKF